MSGSLGNGSVGCDGGGTLTTAVGGGGGGAAATMGFFAHPARASDRASATVIRSERIMLSPPGWNATRRVLQEADEA